MKGWLITGMIVLGTLRATAIDYLVFEQGGLVGLKDTNGQVVIPAAFESLGWSDGSFSMIGEVTGYKLSDKWGLINLKKERITNALYESLVRSEGDRVIVRKQIDPIHVKAGCIDLQGKTTIPFKYDGIRIHGLRAIVFLKEGARYRYGVVDLNDHLVIPLQYKNIYPIGDLRFGVENFEDKTALFSEAGTRLTSFDIDHVSTFRRNLAVISRNQRQGLMNREGTIVLPPEYAEVAVDYDGTVRTRKPNEWRVLTHDNQVLQTLLIDELKPAGSNYLTRMASRFGMMSNQFKPMLDAQYDFLSEPQRDKLVASKDGRFGVIRINGEPLIPHQYDSIVLHDNFVLVRESLLGAPSWTLYDTFGIRKTERSYDALQPFNGRFFIAKNYGKTGVVNRFGKEIIPCVYDSILDWKDDQLLVRFHGQYGIIDFEENWLLSPQSARLRLVDQDHYVQFVGKQNLFKSFDGKLIYFTDNPLAIGNQLLIEVLPDGTRKEINFDGVTVSRTMAALEDDTEIVLAEQEGYRGIKRDGRYGFIDQRGRLRIANRYQAIQSFSEGLAAVKILGKWGFVNPQEKIVVNPNYEEVSEFKNGLAIVKRLGQYGLIDKEGQVIIHPRYDGIERLPNGNYTIKTGDLLGLATTEGRLLLEPRFENLSDCGNGYIIVSQAGKWGLITVEGVSTIPMIYDGVSYLPGKDQYLAVIRSDWQARQVR